MFFPVADAVGGVDDEFAPLNPQFGLVAGEQERAEVLAVLLLQVRDQPPLRASLPSHAYLRPASRNRAGTASLRSR